jgi:hypothetical protein
MGARANVSGEKSGGYDLERVRRYYNETGFDYACPVCHAGKWIVINGKSLEPAVILLSPAGDMRGSRPAHVSTYCMHCENCGFVRQHVRSVIDEYLEAHPEPPPAVVPDDDDIDQTDESGIETE